MADAKDIFKQINMGDDDDCWEWIGAINKKDGRPYFTVDRRKRPAYAIVLEMFSGEAQRDRYVLHQCDNPICCNPHHLKWGTHQENMDEMKARERHGLPKIVLNAMYKLRIKGKTYEEIADLYGVDRTAVSKALKRLEKDAEKKLENFTGSQ